MKLTYHISQTSEFETNSIIKRILLKLNEEKYGVLSVTNNSVTFDISTGGLYWRHQYFSRVNKGKFEIISNGITNHINFEYIPLPMSELIFVSTITIAFITFGIANGTLAGCIGLIFVLQMIIKFFYLKSKAVEMLTEIAT